MATTMELIHSHRLQSIDRYNLQLNAHLFIPKDYNNEKKIIIYYINFRGHRFIDRMEFFDLPFRGKHSSFVRRLTPSGKIILPNGPNCRTITIDPFIELQKFCSDFPKIKFDKRRKSISYCR